MSLINALYTEIDDTDVDITVFNNGQSLSIEEIIINLPEVAKRFLSGRTVNSELESILADGSNKFNPELQTKTTFYIGQIASRITSSVDLTLADDFVDNLNRGGVFAVLPVVAQLANDRSRITSVRVFRNAMEELEAANSVITLLSTCPITMKLAAYFIKREYEAINNLKGHNYNNSNVVSRENKLISDIDNIVKKINAVGTVIGDYTVPKSKKSPSIFPIVMRNLACTKVIGTVLAILTKFLRDVKSGIEHNRSIDEMIADNYTQQILERSYKSLLMLYHDLTNPYDSTARGVERNTIFREAVLTSQHRESYAIYYNDINHRKYVFDNFQACRETGILNMPKLENFRDNGYPSLLENHPVLSEANLLLGKTVGTLQDLQGGRIFSKGEEDNLLEEQFLSILNSYSESEYTFTEVRIMDKDQIAVQLTEPVPIKYMSLEYCGSSHKSRLLKFNEEYFKLINKNKLNSRTFQFKFKLNDDKKIAITSSVTVLDDNFKEVEAIDYNAPHISKGGTYCMGTLSSGNGGKKFTIAEFLRMIEVYNPNSAYNQVIYDEGGVKREIRGVFSSAYLINPDAIETKFGKVIDKSIDTDSPNGLFAIPEEYKMYMKGGVNGNH